MLNGVSELRLVAGLQRRQQIQIPEVKFPVTYPVERHGAERVSAPTLRS